MASVADIQQNGKHLLGVDRMQVQTSTMNAFGLTMDDNLMKVGGRALKPPSLRYRDIDSYNPQTSQWNLRGVKFFKSPKDGVTKWGLLEIRAGRPANLDLRVMSNAFRNAGLPINPNPIKKSVQYRQNDPSWAKEVHSQLENLKNGKVQIVLVILPTPSLQNYEHVRYIADIRCGIPTVCVLAEHVSEAGIPYFANLAMKFNIKMGGCNHVLTAPGYQGVNMNDTIIVGYDVTHPPPGPDNTGFSTAGLVASYDEDLSQWPAYLHKQNGMAEMVDKVGEMLEQALYRWKSENKAEKLPQNIIIYRDGVSEGQHQHVLKKEMPGIRAALDKVYNQHARSNIKPKLTLVIAVKRHNTRFFTSRIYNSQPTGPFHNPVPGTVVNQDITEAYHWDFFLQAHKALTGTARPTHYQVLHDEIFVDLATKRGGNPVDLLEQFTHNLCYIFGRATSAVSLCTPVYYADLLCSRAKQYVAVQKRAYGCTDQTASVTLPASLSGSMFYL